MRNDDFLKSFLALRAWQDGYEEGLNGMMAVAFAIRDRVRAGMYGGNWVQVLSHHSEWSAKLERPSDDLPDPNNYAVRGLLQSIDGIFNGSTPNTITMAQDPATNFISLAPAPQPPLYYGRLDKITNPWFLETICRDHDKHKRVASVGMLTFFT